LHKNSLGIRAQELEQLRIKQITGNEELEKTIIIIFLDSLPQGIFVTM